MGLKYTATQRVQDMIEQGEASKNRSKVFRESHLDKVPLEQRRFYVWANPRFLTIIGILVIVPILVAWIQYLGWGLPADMGYPSIASLPESAAHGFPGWIRITHFVNFMFMILLVRSGLSILMDHPRLYLDRGCTPGNEVIKFNKVKIPKDRIWTAKDDCVYLSPLWSLPGGKHTVGIARSWHFLSVLVFLVNGFIFVGLLLFTNQWQRLVPTSFDIVGQAWNVWVHYATLHLPVEPNGFYFYNPLQQLAYFGVVFIMAPLSLLTGLAMSPAIDNRYPWYPKLFGNRQVARLIHFLLLLGYIGFVIVHVGLVIYTGFARNMNHIVFGTDVSNMTGIWVGLAAIAAMIAVIAGINVFAWKHPEVAQKLHKVIITPFLAVTLNPLKPSERYTEKDISPHYWPNGKMPVSEDWLTLKENGFQDYKLKIFGLVEHPMEISFGDLLKMMDITTISHHHCIQGWSGIAKWEGVSFKKIIDMVKPLPSAKTAVFVSYGEGLEGGLYYNTQLTSNLINEECMLALKMNGKLLPIEHGAPSRLRVENQLGYKMVKWIRDIEFVESEAPIGLGHGGKNEDDEFFDLIPNI